jgi:DNA repair protein RadC
VLYAEDHALLREVLGPAPSLAAAVPVGHLLEAEPGELLALGFSEAACRRLLAVAELARRHQPASSPLRPVLRPRDALPYLAPIRAEPREVVVALPLDGGLAVAGGLIRVAEGALASVAVEAREVFAPVLERRAAALILAHNHPSGRLEPSLADVEFTCAMVAAGEVLGVPVLDHLLVTRRGYRSLAESGLLTGPAGVVVDHRDRVSRLGART